MKICTRYDRPKTKPAPTGDGFENTYHIEIDKETRHKTLIKNDEKENRWAKIQENKNDCMIENIVTRYVATKDEKILNKVKSEFMDMTKMPKNLGDLQNQIIKMQGDFSQLPVEIKRQFDNSPERYVAEFGSEYWQKVMGIPEAKAAIEKAKESAAYEEQLRQDALKNLAKKGDKE